MAKVLMMVLIKTWPAKHIHISVDDVVAVIRRAGKGALLGKMDIKQAYRNVPVLAKDRHLLGIQ